MTGKAEGRILFISDLHLEETRPQVLGAFLSFLDREASRADALFILGDFFNVWIGDDHVTDLSKTVNAALGEVAMGGTGVYLMHGNRDFLLGQGFSQGCLARLLDDPHPLELNGRPCLLSHGDALCTRDTDYQAFRAQVRDGGWQRQFLSKPLEARQAFADQARARSRASTSMLAEDITDVTPSEVEKLMRAHGVSLLIHGHTHRPAVHEFSLAGEPARRVVLGDWVNKGWFFESSPEGDALKSFDIR